MSYGLYLPLAKALNISTIYSYKIADALGSEKCKALFFCMPLVEEKHCLGNLLNGIWWGDLSTMLFTIDTCRWRFYLSSSTACRTFFMIIQTLLRKWMKQASSALLGKEEQWWHLFHLLKQHYKIKELLAGHVCLFRCLLLHTDLIKLYKH